MVSFLCFRAAGSRRGRGNAGGGRQEPYIQVRQEEIADDYPAPKEYKGEDDEEEWDELELEVQREYMFVWQ